METDGQTDIEDLQAAAQCEEAEDTFDVSSKSCLSDDELYQASLLTEIISRAISQMLAALLFTVAHYPIITCSRSTLRSQYHLQMRARTIGAKLLIAEQQMQLMCRVHV
ncbi:Hypothetical predicted protein [Scomber scombrus]|uniref:Uncharacterized protein n=1 Tax=Scomber scombrus TaxID=13677 RepID=A0AAV1QCU6_SCOSC